MQETGHASMASSMHSSGPPSGLMTSDFSLSLSSLKTSGHTSSQFPQPIHSSSSTTTFLAIRVSISNRWRDGDQGPQLAPGLEPVGFGDVAHKHIACSRRKGGAVFSKELSDPFDDDNAHLAFNVVAVNGEFLAGPEIEIDDFEIGGIV